MSSAWRITGWVAPLALVLSLGLAGCAPVTPVVAPATGEPAEAPECVMVLPDMTIVSCTDAVPPLTNVERDAACVPIVPFDADPAGDFMAVQGLTVGWTFGVNFDATWDGTPLACLRLYHLDTVTLTASGAISHTAVAIDRGGIPVATCQLIDGATIDPERGVAPLCGQGYVQCEMRLGGWFVDRQTLSLVAASDYGQTNANAPQDVKSLTQQGDNAPYPKISLVARTVWAPADTLVPPVQSTYNYVPTQPFDPNSTVCRATHTEQPLLTFTPAGENAPQHMLALQVERPEFAQFSTAGSCPDGWMLGSGWNTTYNHLEIVGGTPQHFFENWQEPAGMLSSVATCTQTSVRPVEFWLGQGLLVIGEQDGISMEGIIDGVLIDPLDSRPPS